MGINIDFDAEDIIEHLDDELRSFVEAAMENNNVVTTSNLGDALECAGFETYRTMEDRFDDRYLTRGNLEDTTATVIKDHLDSLPSDYDRRCSLGRAFTDAVLKVVADVVNGSHYEAEVLRDQMLGLVRENIAAEPGTASTFTLEGATVAVNVQAAEPPTGEQFCVTTQDAYGRTTAIYGPFASAGHAHLFIEQSPSLDPAHTYTVPMPSAAPGHRLIDQPGR